MAILRGGKRIGNYDIRIGLPRDRSLDNVNADERLRRKPGGNPETTINRFIAQVNQGEGLARPTRYLVVIQPPRNIIGSVKQGNNGLDITLTDTSSAGGLNELESNELKRNVGMMCNKVTLPSRDITTQPHQMYGLAREMPYGYTAMGKIEVRQNFNERGQNYDK